MNWYHTFQILQVNCITDKLWGSICAKNRLICSQNKTLTWGYVMSLDNTWVGTKLRQSCLTVSSWHVVRLRRYDCHWWNIPIDSGCLWTLHTSSFTYECREQWYQTNCDSTPKGQMIWWSSQCTWFSDTRGRLWAWSQLKYLFTLTYTYLSVALHVLWV